MPSGARKRKASKKKNNKKGESQESNNPNHHSNSNNYSTHSHGSIDVSKSVEESDGGEFEREEEEEEIVDQREVDTEKGEGLKEEVVQVEKEEKSLLNGSGIADFSSVHVAMEEKSLDNGSGSADFSSVHSEEETVAPATEEYVVARNFDVEDKEVAVVIEDDKSVIAEYGKQKAENPSSSVIIDEKEGIVDCVEEEAVVDLKKSVEAQIVEEEDEEDLVKEAVELAPAEFISAGVENLPVPADVVDSELKKNVDSSFSRIWDDKNKLSSAMEAEKSEQIETPVKVAPVDDEDKSSDAPAVSNGAVEDVKPLETDNSGAAVAINTSRGVDNGKELEIQTKPSEEQTPISTNPLPVRRTSWMGCCGLFEVFSGAKR